MLCVTLGRYTRQGSDGSRASRRCGTRTPAQRLLYYIHKCVTITFIKVPHTRLRTVLKQISGIESGYNWTIGKVSRRRLRGFLDDYNRVKAKLEAIDDCSKLLTTTTKGLSPYVSYVLYPHYSIHYSIRPRKVHKTSSISASTGVP